MTLQQKILFTASWVTIAFTMGLMLLFGYWAFYPYKTVVFNDKNFKIENKTIKQGGIIKYKSDYCKYMDKASITTRSFVNDVIYVMPASITNRNIGCNKITVLVKVPDELPMGKYHINMSYKIKVNPIRDIIVEHNTEPFEITEGTASAERRLQGY